MWEVFLILSKTHNLISLSLITASSLKPLADICFLK
jgi:hypothetical protein